MTLTVNFRVVSECWATLRGLNRDFNIRLCWVLGYCDIGENKVADEFSRQDSADQSMSMYRSISLFNRTIREWILGKFNRSLIINF